jgi:Protein of unknown function (DUF1236)
MNGYFRNGMVALALVASAGVASAAGMANSAASNQHLNLTTAQQKEIWQGVSPQATKETTPAAFKATIGAAAPSTITLQPLPTKVGNEVPVVKSYDFAMLQNHVLIVDPSSRKIVDIVNHS